MAKDRQQRGKAARPRRSARAVVSRGPPRNPEDFSVVGIGASAGGLDACRKLIEALPARSGLAFILVQHLDPVHESMMVDLLSGHTKMLVLQATDGMPVERDHLYVIPPGMYLSVVAGALHLSQPQARHGARLPFDFLLHSLAEEYGARAICAILSGTGYDGSLGLKAIKENGGLVVAQDPSEAGYDGMPRNAIATGKVDQVLQVAKMPEAFTNWDRRIARAHTRSGSAASDGQRDWLPEVINLLRSKTTYDFTLYKPGTLQRRIERRMVLANIKNDDIDAYLEILRKDAGELDILAKDLLINVTSFFRDSEVFDLLATKFIPDLIRSHSPEKTLRIWIAGCSTGEEAYSLAMLFREQVAAEMRNVTVQIFASDIDPDAVASAREGLYPESIEVDVSPARLARFFTKEGSSYRVSPELRSAVVFTVQDVLVDPPFSRLDMVSCRNLLIYLRPEAQARAISVFHFALRDNGLLLLGSSETIGNIEGQFAAISKAERLYRRAGHVRAEEFDFSMGLGSSARAFPVPGPSMASARQTALADLCQRLVIDAYAPAAVLINRKHECLYSLGPTDRYLRVAPGQPTHDLFAMVGDVMRNKLRSGIQQASQNGARAVVSGGQALHGGEPVSFGIVVQPVDGEGEELFLIYFVDEPAPARAQSTPMSPQEVSRVGELERELEATRVELKGAIRNLEISSEEQKAINEEALSINEEYQSTNEELLTSKEELQSLNEELTALNSQLQETLERQRATSDDLENVLYSTNVATLFLDKQLNIRYFTPATKGLFNIIPGDIGRPLADLSSVAADSALVVDSRAVLRTLTPTERELESQAGVWYLRRILPYRTHDGDVEGVVITFTDITDRRRVSKALEDAKRQAEMANVAKSRFLAAASHDLRQPLQTLALLQGLLSKMVTGDEAQKLVDRLDQTLGAISGMLNTLLDLNQIEAGTVRTETVSFPINNLLNSMRDEFGYHAQAKGLVMRVVPCSQFIHSDPHLLEQMVRNLLSNALKYTNQGKVLLGCRRHGDVLDIEVGDTGIGIPTGEIEAIFEEYHQIDNDARERSRGLGLGLSIVQRLGNMLDHRVSVRSLLGSGSLFRIEVKLAPDGAASAQLHPARETESVAHEPARGAGSILVVEDNSEVRELLELLLKHEDYHVASAPDGVAALALVKREAFRPDLIIADYNLPNGMNGLDVVATLRKDQQTEIPVIILTGDISTATLRKIALRNCVQLNKPMKPNELKQVINRFLQKRDLTVLPLLAHPISADGVARSAVIFIVDDDSNIRDGMRAIFEAEGKTVEDYASSEEFLAAYRPGREACLLIDAYLPGMSGLELLKQLNDIGRALPSIMITGNSDVPMAVEAMKAGAIDFLEKPISRGELLTGVERALEHSRDATKQSNWHESAAKQIDRLTARERQVMDMVLAGQPSKNIALDLGISQRTVENHRAAIMKKTGAKSLPALARLALAAARNSVGERSASYEAHQSNGK